MQTKNKRQLFVSLIAVLISVFLVVLVVYAATTIGNDVSIGGGLTVSGSTTTEYGTTTAFFNGGKEGAKSDFGIMSRGMGIGIWGAATDMGIMGIGTGYEGLGTTTHTHGICGFVSTGGDEQYGGCLGFYDASTSEHYGLSIVNNSTTTITDIILQNGETISNATSGTIKFTTGDEATTTISIGAASSTACIRLRTADDTGWTYYVSATPGAALTTTTKEACGY